VGRGQAENVSLQGDLIIEDQGCLHSKGLILILLFFHLPSMLFSDFISMKI
jgi:hypothetical protein